MAACSVASRGEGERIPRIAGGWLQEPERSVFRGNSNTMPLFVPPAQGLGCFCEYLSPVTALTCVAPPSLPTKLQPVPCLKSPYEMPDLVSIFLTAY